ncbi:MAG: hypothetical protein ACRDD1_13325 [Planctomycetia bacterium]
MNETVFDWRAFAEGEPIPSEVLGWLPPIELDAERQAVREALRAESPPFQLVGADPAADRDRAFLWDAVKLVNGGKPFPAFAQKTGSCVGQGLARAVWTLMAVEVALKRDPERVVLPFLPYGYGRSRFHAGLRGRGDGSTGAGAAKAARVDGVLPFDAAGLPQPLGGPGDVNGLTWGAAVEREWSDGAGPAAARLDAGRLHVVRATAPVRSADDVRQAVANGYPVTIASSWGGRMRCRVVGSPPVLLNERVTTWMHQMCITGWMRHPELGDLFYVENSWGPEAHGVCPTGAPPGGFWVKRADVDFITAQDDSFAFSDLAGFPARDLDFRAF